MRTLTKQRLLASAERGGALLETPEVGGRGKRRAQRRGGERDRHRPSSDHFRPLGFFSMNWLIHSDVTDFGRSSGKPEAVVAGSEVGRGGPRRCKRRPRAISRPSLGYLSAISRLHLAEGAVPEQLREDAKPAPEAK